MYVPILLAGQLTVLMQSYSANKITVDHIRSPSTTETLSVCIQTLR